MDHTLILTLESHLTKLMYFLILTLQWMKKTWTMTLLQWYAVEMIIPEKTKRTVIPDALKVLRFQPGHKYCLLGRLSHEVGWNHYDTIKGLGHVVQNSTQYPLVVSTWPFIEAVQAAWKAAENGFSAVDLVVEGCSDCEELRCDGTDWSIVW